MGSECYAIYNGGSQWSKILPMPWRGVLHTTEGPTLASAISEFQSTNFWPHFTIDPAGAIDQHLPLTIGARLTVK